MHHPRSGKISGKKGIWCYLLQEKQVRNGLVDYFHASGELKSMRMETVGATVASKTQWKAVEEDRVGEMKKGTKGEMLDAKELRERYFQHDVSHSGK